MDVRRYPPVRGGDYRPAHLKIAQDEPSGREGSYQANGRSSPGWTGMGVGGASSGAGPGSISGRAGAGSISGRGGSGCPGSPAVVKA